MKLGPEQSFHNLQPELFTEAYINNLDPLPNFTEFPIEGCNGRSLTLDEINETVFPWFRENLIDHVAVNNLSRNLIIDPSRTHEVRVITWLKYLMEHRDLINEINNCEESDRKAFLNVLNDSISDV